MYHIYKNRSSVQYIGSVVRSLHSNYIFETWDLGSNTYKNRSWVQYVWTLRKPKVIPKFDLAKYFDNIVENDDDIISVI